MDTAVEMGLADTDGCDTRQLTSIWPTCIGNTLQGDSININYTRFINMVNGIAIFTMFVIL